MTGPQSRLEWALWHAELGLRVFPIAEPLDGACSCRMAANCESPGKHPRIKNWQKEATDDPAKINEWWLKWPRANIGALTGLKGGFVVLDVDPRHDGHNSLNRLLGKHGCLPAGPVDQTGGGGKHFFFATPDVPTKSCGAIFGRDFPGLDFKGGSADRPSYVVLPGSDHVSGGAYRWEADSELKQIPLPQLPTWLLDVVSGAPRTRVADRTSGVANTRYREGERNDALFRIGCSWRAKGLGQPAIEAELLAANAEQCDPPLVDSEVRSIALSCGTYPAGSEVARAEALSVGPPSTRLDDVLNTVEGYLRRYVICPSDAEYVAISLWISHTWCSEQFESSPYLGITSAEKQSGKSRLQDVLEVLCRSPWRAVTPTDAVIYRKIEAEHPTLLLDEVDAIFGPHSGQYHEGLRALLNAGNRKGVKVPRMTGQKGDNLREFDVFCPKALAGIDKLPGTVADRCIPIRLRRRMKSELIVRFRAAQAMTEAAPIRHELAAHGQAIDASATPELPEVLGDRAADGWEPLLVIADAAGGAWPVRARKAAVALNGSRENDESLGVQLLRDCKATFESSGEERLGSSTLVCQLKQFEESPWAEFGKGRDGLSTNGLARLLKPYGIRPQNMRVGDSNGVSGVSKGYIKAAFEEAWACYLDDTSGTSDQPATPLQEPFPGESISG